MEAIYQDMSSNRCGGIDRDLWCHGKLSINRSIQNWHWYIRSRWLQDI